MELCFGLYKIFSAGKFGKMLIKFPIPWKEITFSYYGSLSRKQSIMKKRKQLLPPQPHFDQSELSFPNWGNRNNCFISIVSYHVIWILSHVRYDLHFSEQHVDLLKSRYKYSVLLKNISSHSAAKSEIWLKQSFGGFYKQTKGPNSLWCLILCGPVQTCGGLDFLKIFTWYTLPCQKWILLDFKNKFGAR